MVEQLMQYSHTKRFGIYIMKHNFYLLVGIFINANNQLAYYRRFFSRKTVELSSQA
jgi:hypothetical protein